MICMEINDNNIKIIVYKNNFKPYIHKIITLEQSIVENGYLIKKDKLIHIIESFINENNIKSKNVLLNIQSNSIITRNIILPKLEKNELKNSIQFQIKEIFPIDMSKYKFDYKINAIREQHYNILIVAVDINLIKQYTNLFESLNLKIIRIDTKFNSISKLFINKISEEEILALIDIDKSISDFIILTKNEILFTKTIPLGLNKIDMFIDEIYKFIDFYNSRNNVEITKIHIIGQCAYETNIIDYIKSNFNIKIEMIDVEKNTLSFLSLFGLTKKYNYKDFNLIENKQQSKYLFVLKYILITFAFFTIMTLPYVVVEFKQRILYNLNSKINTHQFNQLVTARNTLENTKDKLKSYNQIIGKIENNHFYNYLELISNYILDSNYINSININNIDNYIIINGSIKSIDLLFEFIENLKLIKIFQNINFSFSSDENDIVHYTIEISIKLGDNYEK